MATFYGVSKSLWGHMASVRLRVTYSLQFTTRQVLDFLVNEIVKLQGLDNVSLELGRQERGLDLLEEELPNGTLELGSDGLRLHADLHLGNLLGSVGLENTRQETAESRLE